MRDIEAHNAKWQRLYEDCLAIGCCQVEQRVACPHCRAEAGEVCRKASGEYCGPHHVRNLAFVQWRKAKVSGGVVGETHPRGVKNS